MLEKYFFVKMFIIMLLHMYQIFSSLRGHLHYLVHFFFTFMVNFFFDHPISIRNTLVSRHTPNTHIISNDSTWERRSLPVKTVDRLNGWSYKGLVSSPLYYSVSQSDGPSKKQTYKSVKFKKADNFTYSRYSKLLNKKLLNQMVCENLSFEVKGAHITQLNFTYLRGLTYS